MDMNNQYLKTLLTDFNLRQKTDFATTEVIPLLHQRSRFYDDLLQLLWRQYGFADRADLALLAVGGYGRKEMFPLSDLDILVLTANPITENDRSRLNEMFNLLWDSKLQVGASIRTIEECIDIGKKEISVATNMLESRCIFGNEKLWQTLMENLYHSDFWKLEDFFQAKIAEKEERYARYNNTSYNLEPDLKHSPGGLRDLHLLSWIMLRHYGVYSIEQMHAKGILFPEEYQELKQAESLLFRMRFGLHLQLKRYDNRLRFDRQLQLSEQLGYRGEGNQPVEMMMKHFFQATQSISQLTQLVLNSFEQTVFQDLQKIGANQPLDASFFLRDNTIFAVNPIIFQKEPHSILDLFFHLTQHPNATVSATTLRNLRLTLQKLPQPLSESAKARQRFIQLFEQPNVIKKAIVPMHQLGVLSAYLPQWQGIEGLMQFDLFHIYTVDEHSVRVMLKLESFLDPLNHEHYPLCCELFPRLLDRRLIYLAALFHDIAKGREGDHAKVGAVDMREFAEQHGFNQTETDFMVWLVAEHLTMSTTAQRRDIHDPDVVKEFAKIVGNRNALSALTCLTIADICATNETLWNDWKSTLFQNLYRFTVQQLKLGDNKSIDYLQIAAMNKAKALTELSKQLTHIQQNLVTTFWHSCPESYFVRNSETQLIWHALGVIQNHSLPMVLVSNEYARGATEIFVYCEDQPQLFARIAQTLSQKKISIHDAQIITSDNGLVLDSFIVTETNGQPLSDERILFIYNALVATLSSSKKAAFKLTKQPVKHQSFKRKTKVRFLTHSHPNHTGFELFTLDREGLLAQIGFIFSQLDLNLVNAKITTIGERVEDFFVVTTKENLALNEQEKKILKSHILQELSNE